MTFLQLALQNGQEGVDWVKESLIGVAFLTAFSLSHLISGKASKDLKDAVEGAHKSQKDTLDNDRKEYRLALERIASSFEKALSARTDDYRDLHRMHAELIEKVGLLTTAVHETRQMVLSHILTGRQNPDQKVIQS